jgi:hypothetical protein
VEPPAVAPDHPAPQHSPPSVAQDGLATLTASADPRDRELVSSLLGTVAEATVEGASHAKRLADDPTPRRTLFWTQLGFGAVLLTLFTTIAVPVVQSRGDTAKESAHQREVQQQHDDELKREDALIEILRVVTKKPAAKAVKPHAAPKALPGNATRKALPPPSPAPKH